MASAIKLLVVDDDMTLRELYEERMRAEGYTIVSASDGEEAIEKATKEHPDAILLDIMMPKINGIDVMKMLRENEGTKNIPIIVLTALVQEIDKVKEMMRPNDGYLIKSEIMPKDVVEKVRLAIQPNPEQKDS